MKYFAFLFYSRFFIPLAHFLFFVFHPFFKDTKWAKFYLERKDYHKQIPQMPERPIWIHASSGEIEYARSVIRAIKAYAPSTPVLVTYSSTSAIKMLANLKEVDYWLPSPWDSPREVSRFLELTRPRALLFSRTDVWPTLVTLAKRKGVPSCLFAGTFSQNRLRLKGLVRWVDQWALQQLSQVFAVSKEDQKAYESWGCRTVEIAGDTRFDQVFHRLSQPKPIREELRPRNHFPTLVAGSTWPEDERILVEFLKSKPAINCVLVPHEVDNEHREMLGQMLTSSQIKFQWYSSATHWNDDQILIVDQVGVLAELYKWGQMAFVGGSFREKVHSVMEPLAAGLLTFVGPYHTNNREAQFFQQHSLKALVDLTMVTGISGAQDLIKCIGLLPNKNDGFSAISRAIVERVHQQEGATDRVIQWLKMRQVF